MEIRNLVVPVDFSEGSKGALARATMLASRYRAPIHLLHTVEAVQYPTHFHVPAALRTELEAMASTQLAKWAHDVEGTGCQVTHTVRYGRPARVICDVAERQENPLIVMGTHGYSGFRRAVMGSVAERTLRYALCPVMAVREEPEKAARPFERVLVATDFSPNAESATDIAIEMCQEFGAEFHLVHALHLTSPSIPDLTLPESYFPEAARKVATGRLESANERAKAAGIEGTVNLVEGVASHAISEFAEKLNPDLIVLGTRGHTGLTHLVSLGSVAERVLRGASCSVLVTKLTDEEA